MMVYDKEYYEKNKNKFRRYYRKWKKKNPEKVRAQKRRWREKHREEITITFKKWKDNTNYSEKMKIYNQKYKKENSEMIKIGSFAKYYLKNDIIKERGNKCEVCGKSPNYLDLHHIVYNNKSENLILLCRGCHMKVHKNVISIKRRLK